VVLAVIEDLLDAMPGKPRHWHSAHSVYAGLGRIHR